MTSTDWLAPLRRSAWAEPLAAFIDGPDAARLGAFLAEEQAAGAQILPPSDAWFRAYEAVAPEDVRVVVIGQDPYPTPGHAHGLAFSYAGEGTLPRSLKNILVELAEDLAVELPTRGDLTPWADRGVLLLNTVLTVRAGEAGSHRRKGWEALTQAAVAHIVAGTTPVVFLLWGNDARKVAKVVGPPHHVLEAGHPSPLSIRYFRGCRPFSQANALLGARAVDWEL